MPLPLIKRIVRGSLLVIAFPLNLAAQIAGRDSAKVAIAQKRDWASDVVAAAGLGTYAGILFDRFNKRYPGNVFDRVFLPSSIVPAPRGVSVAWSFAR